MIDSDHHAINCEVRIILKLQKKTVVKEKELILDFNRFSNPEVVNDFYKSVQAYSLLTKMMTHHIRSFQTI